MSFLELTRVIAKGKNKMPPYEGRLTPEQIRDLARYIRELK
jgi:mono/diheme cytochrome c family protein